MRHERIEVQGAQTVFKGIGLNAQPGTRPVHIDGHVTVPALFRARCKANGGAVAHREKDLGI